MRVLSMTMMVAIGCVFVFGCEPEETAAPVGVTCADGSQPMYVDGVRICTDEPVQGGPIDPEAPCAGEYPPESYMKLIGSSTVTTISGSGAFDAQTVRIYACANPLSFGGGDLHIVGDRSNPIGLFSDAERARFDEFTLNRNDGGMILETLAGPSSVGEGFDDYLGFVTLDLHHRITIRSNSYIDLTISAVALDLDGGTGVLQDKFRLDFRNLLLFISLSDGSERIVYPQYEKYPYYELVVLL